MKRSISEISNTDIFGDNVESQRKLENNVEYSEQDSNYNFDNDEVSMIDKVLERYKEKVNEMQFKILQSCFNKNSKNNIFITGPGGTGKSYLINIIKSICRDVNKKIAITATTGCASILIGGNTVNSFFGIGLADNINLDYSKSLSKYKMNNIKKLDIILIDEISMLNMNCMIILDKLLKTVFSKSFDDLGNSRKDCAFGGVQVIFIGDFLQLPPINNNNNNNNGIVEKYIFKSKIWNDLKLKYFALNVNYRQSLDSEYNHFLSKMRCGSLTLEEFEKIKQLVSKKTDLLLDKEKQNATNKSCITTFFSYKNDVEKFNYEKFKQLDGKEEVFKAYGTNNGMLEKIVPVPKELHLKIGASVMLCKNLNSVDTRLFNGLQGTVIRFEKQYNKTYPVVHFTNNIQSLIIESKWEIYDTIDVDKLVAEFIQLPLIMSYAITIHKSQGMTLEKAMISGNFFECGQAYVAFSRIKSIEGLHISKNVSFNSIKTDSQVLAFYKNNNLL